jgi:ADP-ribosylglycohydrolase
MNMGSGPEITPDVLNRGRGALLGQLVGDALGTTVEFKTAADIAALYPHGLRDIVEEAPSASGRAR